MALFDFFFFRGRAAVGAFVGGIIPGPLFFSVLSFFRCLLAVVYYLVYLVCCWHEFISEGYYYWCSRRDRCTTVRYVLLLVGLVVSGRSLLKGACTRTCTRLSLCVYYTEVLGSTVYRGLCGFAHVLFWVFFSRAPLPIYLPTYLPTYQVLASDADNLRV